MSRKYLVLLFNKMAEPQVVNLGRAQISRFYSEPYSMRDKFACSLILNSHRNHFVSQLDPTSMAAVKDKSSIRGSAGDACYKENWTSGKHADRNTKR